MSVLFLSIICRWVEIADQTRLQNVDIGGAGAILDPADVHGVIAGSLPRLENETLPLVGFVGLADRIVDQVDGKPPP